MKILTRILRFLATLFGSDDGKYWPDEPSTSVRAEVSSSGRETFDETSPGLSEPSTRRW